MVATAEWRLQPPPFIRNVRRTGRRAQGLRYERRGQEYLCGLYGDFYIPGPWLRYEEAGVGWRWCQPDGVLFLPASGRIVLIEFKYQHTADAWWQTRQLYLPVLKALFPPRLWAHEVCEVVKWFDGSTAFPEATALVPDPAIPSGRFKVHIWRPTSS